jgi:hypothetical protein
MVLLRHTLLLSLLSSAGSSLSLDRGVSSEEVPTSWRRYDVHKG